nr:putative holin [Acidovorax sp. SUPP2522]
MGTTEPEHDADFPVVQPYLRAFCAAQLRRAIVVAAVVIGVAQGI